MTQAGNKIYLHILDAKLTAVTFTPIGFKKIKKAYLLIDNRPVNYSLKKNLYQINTTFNQEEIDHVVVLEVSN